MREHHCVDQADPVRDARRDQIGKCREHTGPEEDRSRDGGGELELFEQPQREQRLHDEPAAECEPILSSVSYPGPVARVFK